MLVERKGLAKISAKPGKTQTVNHFIVNQSWYLVDLPGYGYASVGKATKSTWPAMISEYLTGRESLANTFVLIDCRLEPQAIDLDFVNWMGKEGLPFSLVFTKADKISTTALNNTAGAWAQRLSQTWEQLPPIFVTSAEKKKGREDLLKYIDQVIKTLPPSKFDQRK